MEFPECNGERVTISQGDVESLLTVRIDPVYGEYDIGDDTRQEFFRGPKEPSTLSRRSRADD